MTATKKRKAKQSSKPLTAEEKNIVHHYTDGVIRIKKGPRAGQVSAAYNKCITYNTELILECKPQPKPARVINTAEVPKVKGNPGAYRLRERFAAAQDEKKLTFPIRIVCVDEPDQPIVSATLCGEEVPLRDITFFNILSADIIDQSLNKYNAKKNNTIQEPCECHFCTKAKEENKDADIMDVDIDVPKENIVPIVPVDPTDDGSRLLIQEMLRICEQRNDEERKAEEAKRKESEAKAQAAKEKEMAKALASEAKHMVELSKKEGITFKTWREYYRFKVSYCLFLRCPYTIRFMLRRP